MKKNIHDIPCPRCGEKELDIDWMGTAGGGYVDTKTGRISEPDEVKITFEIIHCGASGCG
jgi:hypothetical protein